MKCLFERTRLLNFVSDFVFNTKIRHFWKNMNCADLIPPHNVRGMIELDREKFRKQIKVPKLVVAEEIVDKIRPFIKQFLLKMEKLKPIRPVSNNGEKGEKEILLHPLGVKGWISLPNELLSFGVTEEHFSFGELELNYDNWRADEIIKSVLPDHQEALTSFSRIGHIVHINLREHLFPYKQLIGEVLKDKTACRTVVNKSQTIHNTFRNMPVELICGDPDYQVEVKENGIVFEFDFSTVYWNPRLSTEHKRIVNLLQPGDILYDVFAGVGPFSVPAAKKKCIVLANDLNPESFKYLNRNAKRNKCQDRITTFNKDGKQFIQEDVKKDLVKRYQSGNVNKIHITMNLPALATEFLSAFRGLLSGEDIAQSSIKCPIVHVYSFVKGENREVLVREAVESNLGFQLRNNLDGIYYVRNVAPNKDMYRVSFYLTPEILFSNVMKRSSSYEQVKCNKKACS